MSKMTREKAARRDKFAAMTVDDIFNVWKEAFLGGLADGVTLAPVILDPGERIIKNYKTGIRNRLCDTAHPFSAADHRNTKRVAKDMARICNIVVAEDPDRRVTVQQFDRAAALGRVHASCPPPHTTGGGTWCDVA